MNIIPFPGPDHRNERTTKPAEDRTDAGRWRWVELTGHALVILAGCWSLLAALGSIATFSKKAHPAVMNVWATNREGASIPLASTAATNGQSGVWADSISAPASSRVATNNTPAKPRSESQTTAG